ncbi:TolC family outer membrane protein [Achromobacter xylosoxidans]
MRVRSLTALLVFTCAASVGPSRAHAADDLMQVWRTALGSDPVYAAARANYRASLEKEPQARAGLLPQISAEAGGAYRETRSTQGFGMAYSGGRGTWDLALTQPLFNWSRWQAYEQSKLLTADAEVRLQQAFQDLLLRVAEAYFNVLYAQDALTATEAEKAAVAGQLESAKRNFELGNATITDTYEAQARYDLVLAQELRLQNDLDVRRDVLAQILGSPAGALAELPPGVRLPSPQPARLNDWSTQAEASSLDVLRAQLQTRIAYRDIQIARSGHYPTVNLRATSGSASDAVMSNGSGAPGKPINNSVGVVLSIPLYSGGGVSSQVTERVQLEQKARHDFEAARRLAVQAARQHYTGVTSGLARIDALEAGEKSSRASVEANRTGYEVGVRISLDVLNAQQQLYATQRDLALARYTTLLSGLRLKAVSGILAETDLEAINRLLREPR